MLSFFGDKVSSGKSRRSESDRLDLAIELKHELKHDLELNSNLSLQTLSPETCKSLHIFPFDQLDFRTFVIKVEKVRYQSST